MVRMVDKLLGRKVKAEVEVEIPNASLGTEYGAHVVCVEVLDSESIVYSFGLGEDISFDLKLIERVGCCVQGFDPTPRAIDYVTSLNPPSRFQLHHFGLSAEDGSLTFYPPKNEEHVSWSLVNKSRSSQKPVEVPVKRLRTVMDEKGHTRLDVLKMDIEGAECAVLDDILGDIQIDQILVEFHPHFANIGVDKTQRTLTALSAAGYRIFAISPRGKEMSFIHEDKLASLDKPGGTENA